MAEQRSLVVTFSNSRSHRWGDYVACNMNELCPACTISVCHLPISIKMLFWARETVPYNFEINWSDSECVCVCLVCAQKIRGTHLLSVCLTECVRVVECVQLWWAGGADAGATRDWRWIVREEEGGMRSNAIIDVLLIHHQPVSPPPYISASIPLSTNSQDGSLPQSLPHTPSVPKANPPIRGTLPLCLPLHHQCHVPPPQSLPKPSVIPHPQASFCLSWPACPSRQCLSPAVCHQCSTGTTGVTGHQQTTCTLWLTGTSRCHVIKSMPTWHWGTDISVLLWYSALAVILTVCVWSALFSQASIDSNFYYHNWPLLFWFTRCIRAEP